MATSVTEGGCLCGAVRYRALGTPTHTMLCHCHTCCRAAGSPLVAWLTFPAERFGFVRGAPREFRSSPPVVRTFCPLCGTPLTYTHRERSGEIDVTTLSADQPAAFPPSHHSWVGHSPAWLRFGDDLPAYPAAGQGPEKEA